MTIPRIFEKPYTRVRLPVYMDHRRSYVPNNDGVGRQSTRRLHLHALRPPRTYEYIYTIRTHTYATTHVAALATCTAGGKRPDDGRGRARAGPPVPAAGSPALPRLHMPVAVLSPIRLAVSLWLRPVRSPVTVRPAPQSQAFGTASPNGTVVVVVRS
jgi:hypothetical protein